MFDFPTWYWFAGGASVWLLIGYTLLGIGIQRQGWPEEWQVYLWAPVAWPFHAREFFEYHKF